MQNKGAHKRHNRNKDNTVMCNHTNKEICTLNNVKVLYTNIRSLTSGNNRHELHILTDLDNVDIIGITKTWGKADIAHGEMIIPRYK